MIKKLCLLAVLFVAVCQNAFALLPPLAQNIEELKTILADERLYKILNGAQKIDKIEKTDEGYIFFTQKGDVAVEVIYQQTRKIGPAEYTLNFYRLDSKNQQNENNQ